MIERERLAALEELDILDTPPEKEYDDLVRLASAICGTSISLVSLVGEDRQWFKATVGLDVKETHRDLSFCAHAIRQTEIFEIEDATKDPRFVANGLVTGEMHLRFYAGVPLQAPGGAPIGTLCVIDTTPRRLTEGQREALTILGAQVQARMDLRLKRKALMHSYVENRKLCDSLKSTNDLFVSFMSHGPFASYIKAADGSMLFYNKYLAETSGVSEHEWLGRKDHEIWPVEMADKFRADDLACLDGNVPVEKEDVSPRADGSRVFWKSIKFPCVAANGELALAGISIDVTREVIREAELESALREKSCLASQLEASRHMFRSFMENLPNLAWVKDDQGHFVYYNHAVERFFGIGETDWLGKSIYDALPRADAENYLEQDAQVLAAGGGSLIFFDEMPGPNGQRHHFRTVKFAYKDIAGRTMLARISRDITDEVRQAEALAEAHAKLELLATTDSLTGLLLRRVFSARAEAEFASWKRYGQPLSILTIDVDDFKRRNDTLGHAAGDQALKIIGKVLQSCIRNTDIAARLGGEEFGILLPNTNLEGAMELAVRIQQRLRHEDAGPTPLTLSMGAAGACDITSTWELVLAHADEAMYQAKRSGKNCALCYLDEPELDLEAPRNPAIPMQRS